MKFKILIASLLLFITSFFINAQNTYMWTKAEVSGAYKNINVTVSAENRSLANIPPDYSYHTREFEYSVIGDLMIYNDNTNHQFPELHKPLYVNIIFGYYGIRDNTTANIIQDRAIEGLEIHYNRASYRLLLEERFDPRYIIYRHRSKLKYYIPLFNRQYTVKRINLLLEEEIYTNQEFLFRENRAGIYLQHYFSRHAVINIGYMFRVVEDDEYKGNENVIQCKLLFIIGEPIHNVCCPKNL